MKTFGLDIGGTKILAGAWDGHTLRKVLRISTPETLPEFYNCIEQLVRNLSIGMTSSDVSIGVGIPGTVATDGTCWVPHLPYLSGLPLAEALSTRLACVARVDNDAALALVAETWRGHARGHHNVLLLALGTGIGGAVLMHNDLYRGSHGTAGAFGWLRVQKGREWVTWEDVASGAALARMARLVSPSMTAEEVVQASRTDPAAQQLIIQWATSLGMGIASLVSIFDPELVLITGGVAAAAEVFLPIVRNVVQYHASPSTRSTLIQSAMLGPMAPLWGAIRLASEPIDKQHYLEGAKYYEDR